MLAFLTGFLALVPVSLVQGLIYALVAFAIMVPFRLLSFPDLTAEGAFPLGGAICGALMATGLAPALGILAGTIGGFCAGAATALVAQRFRLSPLLSGIIVVTMLYSVDLRVMGKSNVALFQFDNAFDQIINGLNNALLPKAALLAGLDTAIVLAALWFLRTERGIAFRAVGASLPMATAQGISAATVTIAGVGAAGAISAFAGALVVQSQGFADVNIGIGVLLNGLASLIIGELLLGTASLPRQLAAPMLGAVVYFQLVSVCLAAGLAPSDLKFATGALVLGVLALARLRHGRDVVLARDALG